MKVTLTSEDYENINKLINLKNSAVNIYKELTILELNGLVDSEEYKRKVADLQTFKKLEDDIFNRFNKDEETLALLFNYIYFKDEFRLYDNIMDEVFLVSKSFENASFKRLANRIYDMAFDIKEILKKESPQEYINRLYDKYSINNIFILNAITDDYYDTLIYLIGEAIKTRISDTEKKDLLKVKYGLCLINPRIENSLINNNFNIPSELFLSSQLDLAFIKYEDALYDKVVEFTLEYEYKNIKKENNEDFISLFLKLCYFRINNIIGGDKTIEDFKDEVINKEQAESLIKRFNKDVVVKKISIKK